MSIIISNNHLTARIKEKGAELESLVHSETAIEYIWNANPEFWAKSSPVLFPIVGQLKDDSYLYNGQRYSLPRHGFARDHVFKVEKYAPSFVTFILSSSAETKSRYPFDFELRITYALEATTISVTYEVVNTGSGEMLFSIGAHPAFNVPLTPDTTYKDYYLEFEVLENSSRWTITKKGQIDEAESFLKNTKVLALDKALFKRDALVFKDLKSSQIHLRSFSHTHGFDFTFHGFPFFGIWAAPDADFVCLEPWCGIADATGHNQQFETKEGIEKIAPATKWSRSWEVNCY